MTLSKLSRHRKKKKRIKDVLLNIILQIKLKGFTKEAFENKSHRKEFVTNLSQKKQLITLY